MSTKRSNEDEYIAREEAKRAELAKIKRQQEQEASARAARLGTCPRGCATKLVEEAYQTVLIDRCPTCKGVWLDPGELEKVAGDDASSVRSLLAFFAGKSG